MQLLLLEKNELDEWSYLLYNIDGLTGIKKSWINGLWFTSHVANWLREFCGILFYKKNKLRVVVGGGFLTCHKSQPGSQWPTFTPVRGKQGDVVFFFCAALTPSIWQNYQITSIIWENSKTLSTAEIQNCVWLCF